LHFGSHAQHAGELNSYSIQSDFPTSDGSTGDAVETTAAEAVLTDYTESMPGQQHRVT